MAADSDKSEIIGLAWRLLGLLIGVERFGLDVCCLTE